MENLGKLLRNLGLTIGGLGVFGSLIIGGSLGGSFGIRIGISMALTGILFSILNAAVIVGLGQILDYLKNINWFVQNGLKEQATAEEARARQAAEEERLKELAREAERRKKEAARQREEERKEKERKKKIEAYWEEHANEKLEIENKISKSKELYYSLPKAAQEEKAKLEKYIKDLEYELIKDR